jgi:peptidoglycan hydrolase CwlO-like protein
MEIVVIILWIALSFLMALWGKSKNIGYWGAFFISVILSPIIGFIVVSMSRKKAIFSAKWNKVIKKAEIAEFKGEFEKAIDLYEKTLFHLHKGLEKGDKTFRNSRQKHIDEVKQKIEELQGKIQKPDSE